ncbi:MAG: hypothetical protein SWO11_09165 [Thermodesulfobacteriota bacterium]|nr:hypothetical protein [Thermodesulfobacteriota bacterium]
MNYRRSSIITSIVIILGILFFLIQKGVASEFEFTNSISLSESYDDNIYLETANEKEDFLTSISPGFILSYITQKTNLKAAYNPELQFYANNPDRDEINHNANIGFNGRLTRKITVMVVDNLVFMPAQDVIGREVGARSYASDQLNNNLNATLSYQMFRYTNLRFGTSYRFVDYEMHYLEDNYEYNCGMGFDHELTGSDILSFNYNFRKLLFDWENDTDIHSINIGERHEFAKGLILSISGGIELIDEEDGESKRDWSAGLSITKNFRRTNIGVVYNRNVSASEGIGGTSINQTIALNGKRQFTKKLNSDFTLFFSTEDSVIGYNIDNEDYGLILTATYGFTDNLKGAIGCSYIDQSSYGQEGADTESYRGKIGVLYLIHPLFNAFFSYNYYQQNILGQGEEVESDIVSNLLTVGIQFIWL